MKVHFLVDSSALGEGTTYRGSQGLAKLGVEVHLLVVLACIGLLQSLVRAEVELHWNRGGQHQLFDWLS